MSRRERRKFTDEQKTQAVKLVRDVGSISQVAKDLDLTESALRNWVVRPTSMPATVLRVR